MQYQFGNGSPERRAYSILFLYLCVRVCVYISSLYLAQYSTHCWICSYVVLLFWSEVYISLFYRCFHFFALKHPAVVFSSVLSIRVTFHLMSLYRNTCLSVKKEWCTILVITVCPVSSKMQHCIYVWFAFVIRVYIFVVCLILDCF